MMSSSWQSDREFAYPTAGRSSIRNIPQDILDQTTFSRQSDDLRSSSIYKVKKAVSLAVSQTPESHAYGCVLLKAPLDKKCIYAFSLQVITIQLSSQASKRTCIYFPPKAVQRDFEYVASHQHALASYSPSSLN